MSKLILTHEVSGLGSAGDVVDVKNGFARNYLIPQGFAVAWTRGGEKQVEQIKAARAAREHATIEEAQAPQGTPRGHHRQADRQGRRRRTPVRFGQDLPTSRTPSRQPGLGELDKRKIEIPTPIKATGSTRPRSASATTSSPRSPFRWSRPSSTRRAVGPSDPTPCTS